MPANILNLSSYDVTHIDENEHDYHVTALVQNPPQKCAHCHSGGIRGFGRREQLIKDLPMHGKRVGIYVDTRRYQCQSCNKTFYEPLPDVDEKRKMTKRLVEWIGKQAINRTFTSIADEVGIVEGTVRSIFRDYINELEKTVRFEIPQWMGIDEIHLIKPRCVVSNIQNNTIVEILKDRNKPTVTHYLSQLKGLDQVHYVAMDMWKPYRDAVETVIPDAQIVIDKFHVVRMANDALERVRKSLREQLTPKQRGGLMHDRFVLLKRERDLTDKEAFLLDGWCQNYPELGLAYRQKEDFYAIYEAKSPAEAKTLFNAWLHTLTPDIRDAFSDLVRAWQNWEPYICNYFKHPVTNAYTESLNNLIRVMNRLGRGYSFEALRAKILFAEGAFKTEKKRPKFQRKQVAERFIGYSLATSLDDEYLELPPFLRRSTEDDESTQEVKNYGVDISILTDMIERGLI
ncbi:ISL3 family transposase [Acidihalobacter ferrooxydans]|uniref:ISL3 family transposase n=1 Tax=Acidihalobacter ferrooxydans TaxID=1765967 RepID=A0A1P8UFK4_9GAMM|nr:ISL3 family transposase [Acidihalobacter ferrooxydans]APZ42571.1 ISL3 family transposase [Acidihalobacter ferrooxydans]